MKNDLMKVKIYLDKGDWSSILPLPKLVSDLLKKCRIDDIIGQVCPGFNVCFENMKLRKLNEMKVNFFHVFVNKILPGCLVAAQSTRVFQPFMNCSFVFGKISLCSCLMVTLLARVLYPFMNYSFMFGKIPL